MYVLVVFFVCVFFFSFYLLINIIDIFASEVNAGLSIKLHLFTKHGVASSLSLNPNLLPQKSLVAT